MAKACGRLDAPIAFKRLHADGVLRLQSRVLGAPEFAER